MLNGSTFLRSIQRPIPKWDELKLTNGKLVMFVLSNHKEMKEQPSFLMVGKTNSVGQKTNCTH